MDLIGEAVYMLCQRRDAGFRRINYAILGNFDAYLHAHIDAGYTWEPTNLRHGPVARYPIDVRAAAVQLGPQHDDLRSALTDEIRRLTAKPAPGRAGVEQQQ